jgi:hypothetical protein
MSVSIDYPSFMRAAYEGGAEFLNLMAPLSVETEKLKEAAQTVLATHEAALAKAHRESTDVDALAKAVRNKIDDMRQAITE